MNEMRVQLPDLSDTTGVSSYPLVKSLIVDDNRRGWMIIPPAHLIKDGDLNEVDLELIRMTQFPQLETISFGSIFVKALPRALASISSLREVQVCYSHNVNWITETKKLQNIKKLETIRLSGSILGEEDLESLKKDIPDVEIIY